MPVPGRDGAHVDRPGFAATARHSSGVTRGSLSSSRRSPHARAAILALLISGAPTIAAAHPHVWVTTRSDVVFGADGQMTGIRHHWTFDAAYSAFAVQGLDANGDGKLTPNELQDLAKENVESLADFNYFTSLKAGGVRQAFGAPGDYGMTYDDEQVTLHFLLPLKRPVTVGRSAVLSVYDPTFFVEMSVGEGNAVTLVDAPATCTIDLRRPKTAGTDKSPEPMSEAFFSALTAGSDYGARFSSGVVISCP